MRADGDDERTEASDQRRSEVVGRASRDGRPQLGQEVDAECKSREERRLGTGVRDASGDEPNKNGQDHTGEQPNDLGNVNIELNHVPILSLPPGDVRARPGVRVDLDLNRTRLSEPLEEIDVHDDRNRSESAISQRSQQWSPPQDINRGRELIPGLNRVHEDPDEQQACNHGQNRVLGEDQLARGGLVPLEEQAVDDRECHDTHAPHEEKDVGNHPQRGVDVPDHGILIQSGHNKERRDQCKYRRNGVLDVPPHESIQP